jgi:AcrR family transcriptional regulator
MPTSAPLTARGVARQELTRAILTSARRQLAEVGPRQLSVRAVARDLGMASSAVYRYFPSRDDLLTEVLAGIYGDLVERLKAADATLTRDRLQERWLTLGRTLRSWALAAPHEYAVLFGSPVPGHLPPRQAPRPAARVTAVLVGLARDLDARGPLPSRTPLPEGTHALFATFRGQIGSALSDEVILRAATAWGGLLGAISLELFGHLDRAVTDHATHFELVLARLDPTAN